MTAVLSSAGPVLSLLEEESEDLKIHALQQLNRLVDRFWAEIAPAIAKIEELYDDDKFRERSLAAVVASKVFYHLESLDDALKYALGAGSKFDVSSKSEYVETLIAKCIDEYIRQRNLEAEAKEEKERKIDDRLVSIVERMFERCFDAGEYKQAMGIALEARRIDIIEKSVIKGDQKDMLSHLYNLTQTSIVNRDFRLSVLELLVRLYRNLDVPDYINMCQCLLFLDKADIVAEVLDDILKRDGESNLIGFQVAFDLWESQNQGFLNKVGAALPSPEKEAEHKSDIESYKRYQIAVREKLKKKKEMDN